MLDLGAGAGKNRYHLKGRVRSIVGVDFDPRVAHNPLLDRGVVAKPGPLPFDDNSFDVVFSIYVLEHVNNPAELVAEIRRVLRPGGIFLALTPNRYHYVSLIASATPISFHKWLNKRRGREMEDTFPTAYQMNTRRALRRYRMRIRVRKPTDDRGSTQLPQVLDSGVPVWCALRENRQPLWLAGTISREHSLRLPESSDLIAAPWCVLRRILLYARTARHLRSTQWIYFPIRRMQRLTKPKPTGSAVLNRSGIESLSGAAEFLFAGPDDGLLFRAREILSHRFSFLNHAKQLPVIDWRKRYVSHLWSYNLHYFDYVPDLARAHIETGDPRFLSALESLVTTWIDSTADGSGDGWEPYPTSVRVVNWIHSFLLLEAQFTDSFRLSMSRSLYRQLSYLEKRLERHLLANYLQKNLYALFLGGLIFRGEKADRWRSKGGRMLWAEVEEQVLPDGGHVERSPMYHGLALRDLLEAIHYARAAGEPVPAEVVGRARAMASASGVTRGDPGIHLLNDSAQGVAPSCARVSYLAAYVLGERIAPPAGEWALRVSGFYGHRDRASGDEPGQCLSCSG